MAQLQKLLWSAERPFVIAGVRAERGGGRRSRSASPSASTCPRLLFPASDAFDHAHPNYAGDVGIGINRRSPRGEGGGCLSRSAGG
jgi:acetolactate synthase-1/2/3 large subunit